MMQSNGKFDFNGLFIFEMANNHQGSVDHGKRIISELSAVAKQSGIKAAIKLQFRDLDTFIHPEYRHSKEHKHIQRFLSTRLSDEQFAELVEEIKAQSIITMATPFDERSVDLITRLGVEIIKIASCSAKDWPLLQKAAAAGKPIIASTAGLALSDVDNLVSFLDHRYVNFAIMHCVAIYPTPNAKLQLNQIEVMRHRYSDVPVGFSTHEDPNDFSVIQMAYAKGARLFERHVGVPTETIKLNAYSSTPDQIAKWVRAHKVAELAAGSEGGRSTVDPDEQKDLFSLMRGVYAKRDIKEGEILSAEEVFFAMPLQPGQLTSGEWKENLVADTDYGNNMPIVGSLANQKSTNKQIIYQAIHEVKGMLNQAHIAIGHEFNVELSHHYGLERFREIGVVIIDCINREYCKKILVQLPGQKHPYHHHQKKEETFQLLAGELAVAIEGRRRTLYPGDILVVQRGVKHRFWTDKGAIFEEVSTTHFNNDSIYKDPAINAMPREQRKTKLINWGRHQFD